MPELKTLSGDTYTKVKITNVDAVRMQIRHSGGIKGIPFEELPMDLQDRFQFDSKEKEVRVAKEDDTLKKGHIGSSIGDLKISISDLEHQNTQARAKVAKLEQGLANARAAQPNLKSQLLAKQQELARDEQQRSDRTSNGRQGISRAPQIREEITHIEGQISLASRLIPQHSRTIEQEEQNIRERDQLIGELRRKLGELQAKMKDKQDSKDS